MNAPAHISVDVADPVITAPHVLVAINRVMEDIAREGIAKDRRNATQNYSFRGIDDVYNALAPILVKNRLVVKPKGLARTCEERQSKSGGAIFYVTVTMEFDLISAIDGSRETAGPFYGEAMDSADKATNKAMSAAFKYFAMQQFVIPTEGDNDADGSTHTVETRKPLWIVSAKAAIECLTTQDACADWYRANVAMLRSQDAAGRDEVLAYLKHRKTALAPLPPRAATDAEIDRFHRGNPENMAGRNGHAPGPTPGPFDDEIPF